MTCCAGTSELDGPVEVIVITEEAGTGLGARIAGTLYDDPGGEVGHGPPAVKVHIEGQVVSLWPVSTDLSSGEMGTPGGGRRGARPVAVAGAAPGVGDAAAARRLDPARRQRRGSQLVETPFGGPAPLW